MAWFIYVGHEGSELFKTRLVRGISFPYSKPVEVTAPDTIKKLRAMVDFVETDADADDVSGTDDEAETTDVRRRDKIDDEEGDVDPDAYADEAGNSDEYGALSPTSGRRGRKRKPVVTDGE